MAHQIQGAEPSRRLLGDILIERGVIGEADLEAALATQSETGAPLARILVEAGRVSPHAIAIALADQSGGPLKTEYGFAIASPDAAGGQEPAAADALPLLRIAPNPSAPPTPAAEPVQAEIPAQPEIPVVVVAPVDAEAPVDLEPPVQAEIAFPAEVDATRIARVEAERKLAETEHALASAVADAEALRLRVAALESASAEGETLRSELQRVGEACAAADTALAQTSAELKVATAARLQAESESEMLRARAAELEAMASAAATMHSELEQTRSAGEARESFEAELRHELQAAVAAHSAAEADAEALRTRILALEGVEASNEAAREELRASVAAAHDLAQQLKSELASRQSEAPAPLATRTYSDVRHQLFVPTSERYELVERAGAAPSAGSVVELSGHRTFRVLRTGPSPYPGAAEACAYLEPIA
ncbi:MAG: hypothetical protein ACJ76I_00140 [Gaiellaceae bacterium]